jgi:CDGSH-type Zn-finger protein
MGTKREPAVKKGLIKILKDGPYEVSGGVPLDKAVVVSGADGIPARWKKGARLHPKDKPYHLCRCGHSANKPYCDGTHHKIKFSGKETAPAKTYAELAVKYEGPGLILSDAESLCSVGLFCHRAGDAWTLTEKSGNRKARATAIREACDCPSGRLVATDKRTGKTIEPKLKPGISLVEDPERRASGPLWVKGGIKIKSSKGRAYETRNRVTLCRCGRSVNKPFCDGSHMPFKDGDKSVE